MQESAYEEGIQDKEVRVGLNGKEGEKDQEEREES